MRSILALWALILTLALPATAQEATDIPAVRDTIQGQLDAFQADDFSAAFEFASPRIQQIFRDVQNFERMVRGGYPMVHRPAEVTFHDQEAFNGATYQKVQIKDAEGGQHWLAYEMIQLDGDWRINGVYLIEAPDLSV